MTNLSRRKRADLHKKKWPAYGPLLDFYLVVSEAQDEVRERLKNRETGDPLGIQLKKTAAPHVTKLGIDVDASRKLFLDLCDLAEGGNDHLSSQIKAIKGRLASGDLNLQDLLLQGTDVWEIAATADKASVNESVLAFLVLNSVKPSLEVARDLALKELDTSDWKKVHCPVCAAPPSLSLIKGDPALRFSQCSQCGCQWQVDRMACSVCGSTDRDARSYFHGEGQAVHRVDVCDTCDHYIKTINLAELDDVDPDLEDLASFHLDVIAVERGYRRIVPNIWSS